MGGIGIGMTFRQPTPAAGGGETPWYLAGGVSAENCIAAYQAKGAASYAASKINLAHPGTHDLMDGIAPIWNTEAGWDFTGSDPYLVSDIIGETIGYRNSSILVRMTNISTSPEDGFLFNSWGENNTPSNHTRIYGFNFLPDLTFRTYNYDRYRNFSPLPTYSATDTTVGFSGINIYVDGNYITDMNISATGEDFELPAFYIGAQHYADESYDYAWGNGDCVYVAIAFYNILLTAEQVAAITTAMQAL